MCTRYARATEWAALAGARWLGRADEEAAEEAAANGMKAALDQMPVDGRIVIGSRTGEGLAPGGEIGAGGDRVDLALDPIEGRGVVARGGVGAIAMLAVAPEGALLQLPDMYMRTISVGPRARGVIDLDRPVADNVRAVAESFDRQPLDITALVLDRPRHAHIIEAIRKTGAAVALITDGDVAGVIHTADSSTGIDIYLGIGGAPEGVLAAAALRCIGGQMQGRLVLDTDEKRARAAKMGIKDPRKRYEMEDMVRGDCLFSATGVTSGSMLRGVRFDKEKIETETVVMRSVTGTVRWIRAEHRQLEKFHLD